MSNIRIDLEATVLNGQALTFKAPAHCSEITGLIVYYPEGDTTTSKTFRFADAHGNDVGSVDLFAEDVLVKVVLDTELSRAYVQNADTNAYLEAQLAQKVNLYTSLSQLGLEDDATLDDILYALPAFSVLHYYAFNLSTLFYSCPISSGYLKIEMLDENSYAKITVVDFEYNNYETSCWNCFAFDDGGYFGTTAWNPGSEHTYTYSSTDLIAGEDSLGTGKVHFVYE